MAITFQEQIKRQKNLIFVFIALVLITVVIIWQGYYAEKEVPEKIISRKFREIAINFEVLEHPLLNELQLIEKIPSFEGEPGRENPFVPSF